MAFPRIGAAGLDFTVAKWTALADALEAWATKLIGRVVISGLTLSNGGGLTLNCSAGEISSLSYVNLVGATTLGLGDNATWYIWVNEAGTLSATATTTYPGGNVV